MNNIWLHRYAVLVAVATLFLIAAGASVTSNDAGLSVPDWPLSYGKVMPPMEGGIFFEHGHRMIAATVGFLTVVLAVWLAMAEKRRWVRILGFAALAAVVAQGILGGLTVKYMLPKAVSIGHATLAQTFFGITVALAIFTSSAWKRGSAALEDSGWPSLRSLGIALPLVVLVQVALGAAYRHRAFSLVPHVAGALIVTGFALMVAVFVLIQFRRHRQLSLAARAVIAVVICQVFLGIGAYMSRISYNDSAQPAPMMVLFTILHVGFGALTTGSSVALAVLVARHVRRPGEVMAAAVERAA